MKMTMKEHFTMFATISATIEATTNLSVEEATDMASVIVNEVTEALGIEIEPTEEDVEFMTGGLLLAMLGGLME